MSDRFQPASAHSTWPLSCPFEPNRAAFWTREGALSHGRLLGRAERLARRLPESPLAINYCEARDRFTVALLAIWMRGQTAIFPADRTQSGFDTLRAEFPDLYCLTDVSMPFAGADCVSVGAGGLESGESGQSGEPPALAAGHPAVKIFTSGSTGKPSLNEKTWGMLVAGAQAIPSMLGFDRLRRPSIVGTVPSQHMYGFEITIMNVLRGTGCSHAERPVYPADIARCLNEMPAPRVLVTTPVHLRALMESGTAMPAIDRIVSATAPLSDKLAATVERRLDTQVWEIYGFTEAGSVACRRTIEGPDWTLRGDFAAREESAGTYVEWVPFGQRITFPDLVDILDPAHLRLRGRVQDTINIAGKRASLAGLTVQLLEIEGVEDGALWLPREDEGLGFVSRLVAFVVAPGRSEQEIRRQLHRRMDAAFVPRKIVHVDALPRNATGKLPRDALRDLAARYLRRHAAQ